MNPLKESIELINKRNKMHYAVIALVFLLLFFQAFFSGQHLYRTSQQEAEAFIEMVASSSKVGFIVNLFLEKNYVPAGILIFLNNFLINVFLMYLGIIFVVPALIFISNALVTGMVFGIDSLMSPASPLWHIFFTLVVGILEISSLVLVINESFRIGMALINPGLFKKKRRMDALKQNLKEGTKILFLVMLLLITAAIVETISIAIFSSKFIP